MNSYEIYYRTMLGLFDTDMGGRVRMTTPPKPEKPADPETIVEIIESAKVKRERKAKKRLAQWNGQKGG